MKNILFLLTICSILLASCSKEPETPKFIDAEKGESTVYIDESFKPIMEEQLKVFRARFPDAKLNVVYAAEDICWQQLTNEKVDLVLTTKSLTDEEKSAFQQNNNYYLTQGKLAFDAMAIIVNKSVKDTMLTQQDIVELVKGNKFSDRQLLFDGLSATSTYRYLKETILKNGDFGKNISGIDGTQKVINEVSQNTNLIGFVGISWIGNPEDLEQQKILEKISMVSIKNPIDNLYYKPTFENFSTGYYPYYRTLYYTMTKNYTTVASGFVNFLQYERGQLIFKRGFLLPGKMDFRIRNMEYNFVEGVQ